MPTPLALPLLALLALACAEPPQPETRPAGDPYTYVEPSRDGIGKVYMGREISHVMGHLGVGWLERPEREREEAPTALIDALDLPADATVADIGAGSGYFTFRLAGRVPDGRVLAVDIQPEMLEILNQREAELGLDNVEPVLGEIDDPKLPAESVDLALMVDAYHEFSHPAEMLAGLHAALKPGGRIALVEYRGEDPTVPIKPLHKMTEAQAIKELQANGFGHVETLDVLPTQHLMLFEKPVESADGDQP